MIPEPKPAEWRVSQGAGTAPGAPAASPVAASQAPNLPGNRGFESTAQTLNSSSPLKAPPGSLLASSPSPPHPLGKIQPKGKAEQP